MEGPELEVRKDKAEAHIRQLLIPKDPQDEKNAILEIRAGTGGDEASLFAGTSYACICAIVSAGGGKPRCSARVREP